MAEDLPADFAAYLSERGVGTGFLGERDDSPRGAEMLRQVAEGAIAADDGWTCEDCPYEDRRRAQVWEAAYWYHLHVRRTGGEDLARVRVQVFREELKGG